MHGLLLVAGVFWGSALWWVVLIGTVSLFKRKFDEKVVQRINLVSGILIIGFGLFILGSSLY
jgi:arginine exporter protein ArgO